MQSNDQDVDAAVKELEEYVKDDAKKKKEAADGLVRILHLKYGSDYARKKMEELRGRLEK
jgi:hypothetical protein